MEDHSQTTKKVELYIRFANESDYDSKITINLNQIENPVIFRDEVFVRIGGMTVAIKREDWDNLKLKQNG